MYELLEEWLCNTRRTKRWAARRAVDTSEGADENSSMQNEVQLRVDEAVPLNHLKPGLSVVMFSSANDKVEGSCTSHVRSVEFWGSVEIADMFHEPLGFLSGIV